MKISTKGIYSLKLMLNLANKYHNNKYISLKTIADEENLSLKYLEKIMLTLNKKDYFDTCRGIDGGYKLKYDPSKYSIGDIIKTAEGSIAPVHCVEENYSCPTKMGCSTFKIWKDLDDVINNHLNNKTLADYMKGDKDETIIEDK